MKSSSDKNRNDAFGENQVSRLCLVSGGILSSDISDSVSPLTPRQRSNLNSFIDEALEIEAEEAKNAGTIGFLARSLVQASLPHSNPGDVPVWSRHNGKFSLTIQPGYTHENGQPKSLGLPYGSRPRLILAYLCTQAVRTRSKDILLGDSLSEFMRQLGLSITGGRRGDITSVRTQMIRLLASTVSFRFSDDSVQVGGGFRIASKEVLYWNPKLPSQASLWESYVTLSQELYDHIIESPVPIDMRALKALKRSPMALDLYVWLTYRMSYLKKSTEIPWGVLQLQFGAQYGDTRYGRARFKQKLREQLKKVLTVYSKATVEEGKSGLILRPSLPHIRKL
jgi:hypothetical protein